MTIDGLLQNLLLAGAAAGLLAMVVAAAGWRIRRPSLMHGLWILVLLKMMTPPLVALNVLPAMFKTAPGEAPAVVPATVSLAPAASRFTTELGVLLILAMVSIALAVLLLVRVNRFRRLIGKGQRPAPDLIGRARQIAGRIGVSTLPEIQVVDAAISPMLWPAPSGCRLLLPRKLLQSLTPEEFDVLLAHELAHYRRKDHWVRYLETAVTLLFWWNPVTWWVRRRLRVAEERSCDGMVLEAFPGCSRAYADALLKTVEFAGGHGPGSPAIATGAGSAFDLKERLTMIMKRSIPGGMSPGQRLTLALLAIAVLAVFPTWADKEPEEAQVAREAELTLREAKLEQMEQKLEQQARLLEIQEKRLQEVMEQQQIRLQHMQNKAQDLARMEMDREQARRMEAQVQAMDQQAREMDQQARALAEYAEQLALREQQERRALHPELDEEVKELKKVLQRLLEEVEKKQGTAL